MIPRSVISARQRIFQIMIFIINIFLKKTLNSILSGLSLAIFFCTARTQAKDVQFVAFLNITVFPDKVVLNSLKLRAVNLFELSTFRANQVVVMFVAVLMLKTVRAVPEIDLPANAGLAHQLDRSCYRCIADPGMFLPDRVMQLLYGQVFFGGQEYIQHLFSLIRVS